MMAKKTKEPITKHKTEKLKKIIFVDKRDKKITLRILKNLAKQRLTNGSLSKI